jgi:hypothetical protein
LTDSAFLLSILEDGAQHSQAELLRRSFQERGCGLTIHSRIADLRKQGHYIICDRVPGKTRGEAWTYQLLGSLNAGDPQAGNGDKTATRLDAAGPASSPALNEPETLFTYPRSPAWS